MHGDDRTAQTGPIDIRGLETALVADSMYWRLYERSSADWYDLTLKRASHIHFSDHSLFEASEPKAMHPRLAHEIANRYVLEFFDKYLKDRTDSPLLSGAVSYPDAVLLRNKAAD